MNCQLNKEDILELAAFNMKCHKSDLAIKCKSITCSNVPLANLNVKLFNKTVGDGSLFSESDSNKLYFILSFFTNSKLISLSYADSVNVIDDTPNDGVLINRLSIVKFGDVNTPGNKYAHLIYYEITKVC